MSQNNFKKVAAILTSLMLALSVPAYAKGGHGHGHGNAGGGGEFEAPIPDITVPDVTIPEVPPVVEDVHTRGLERALENHMRFIEEGKGSENAQMVKEGLVEKFMEKLGIEPEPEEPPIEEPPVEEPPIGEEPTGEEPPAEEPPAEEETPTEEEPTTETSPDTTVDEALGL